MNEMTEEQSKEIIKNAIKEDQERSMYLLENYGRYLPNGTLCNYDTHYNYGKFYACSPIILRALIIKDLQEQRRIKMASPPPPPPKHIPKKIEGTKVLEEFLEYIKSCSKEEIEDLLKEVRNKKGR